MTELTLEEAEELHAFHTREADYYLGCKQTNNDIANREPLYTFGDTQTKEDWLERAELFDKIRKYHRTRARLFLKIVEE